LSSILFADAFITMSRSHMTALVTGHDPAGTTICLAGVVFVRTLLRYGPDDVSDS